MKQKCYCNGNEAPKRSSHYHNNTDFAQVRISIYINIYTVGGTYSYILHFNAARTVTFEGFLPPININLANPNETDRSL